MCVTVTVTLSLCLTKHHAIKKQSLLNLAPTHEDVETKSGFLAGKFMRNRPVGR
jgi:hypothetical protein